MLEIEFEAASDEEIEEARKQRLANMTDKWPGLAKAMQGLTWAEIYKLPMAKTAK